MKKQKNKKSQTKYPCIIIVLCVAIACLIGGVIYCGTNMKSYEEREYLDVYEHLLSSYVFRSCDELMGNDAYVCQIDSYGVSKDGDPYVKFKATEYNTEGHEPTGKVQMGTIYFDHMGPNEYGEAMTYEVISE